MHQPLQAWSQASRKEKKTYRLFLNFTAMPLAAGNESYGSSDYCLMLSTQATILIITKDWTVGQDTRASTRFRLCCFPLANQTRMFAQCLLLLPGRRRGSSYCSCKRWHCGSGSVETCDKAGTTRGHGRVGGRGGGERDAMATPTMRLNSMLCSRPQGSDGRSSRGGREVPMLSTRSWFSALRKTHPFPWPGSWLAERINLRQLRVRCHARKSRCSKTHTNLSVHVTSVGFIKSPQEPPTRGWRVGSGSPLVGKFLIHL